MAPREGARPRIPSVRIRPVAPGEYAAVRSLDREAFERNERGSDGDFHERFADRIRGSELYLPGLELVALTDGILIGHMVCAELPMGDGNPRAVWMALLAVRHGAADDHAAGRYEFQRRGVGTAIVAEGLRIAEGLGYVGFLTCGNGAVYRAAMGFSIASEYGITKDESVDEPDGALFAYELVRGGFARTNRTISFARYGFMQGA